MTCVAIHLVMTKSILISVFIRVRSLNAVEVEGGELSQASTREMFTNAILISSSSTRLLLVSFDTFQMLCANMSRQQ